MGHSHAGHSHSGHDHSHNTNNLPRLALACAVAVAVLVAQCIGALVTGSLALLVDTVHVFTDSLGLVIALVAAVLARRPANPRRTWGWKRIEVLSAIFQSVALLAVGVFVLIEAVQRLFTAPEIPGRELLTFGVIGLVGNVLMLVILLGGDRTNFNMRAAFLEVANDALGSVAVIIGALVLRYTGWSFIDTVLALFIGALIIPRTITLFRETASVLMENTPACIDVNALKKHIEDKNEHVIEVHDLHVSQISSDLPVLTAHVILDDTCFHDGHSVEILKDLQHCVAEHFEISIKHSTFQLEPVSMYRGEHYHNLP